MTRARQDSGGAAVKPLGMRRNAEIEKNLS
jgi:hypothetical protein